MLVAQVNIQTKPHCVDKFIEACTHNARASALEEGVLRFDVLQSDEDPTCFILFEVYESSEAQTAHKLTPHFSEWRLGVEDLIVKPGRASMYRYAVDPIDGEA